LWQHDRGSYAGSLARHEVHSIEKWGVNAMAALIWTIVLLLALAWFLGYSVDIGWWIHVLLVIAFIGIIYNLLITPLMAARRPPPPDYPRDYEV
jgi:hypothetical protein